MEVLPDVSRLAGQGLLQKRVSAAAHPAGAVVPRDGDAGLPAQGTPGFLEGKRPGHVAQPKAQIGVHTENQQGGHGPESLGACPSNWKTPRAASPPWMGRGMFLARACAS